MRARSDTAIAQQPASAHKPAGAVAVHSVNWPIFDRAGGGPSKKGGAVPREAGPSRARLAGAAPGIHAMPGSPNASPDSGLSLRPLYLINNFILLQILFMWTFGPFNLLFKSGAGTARVSTPTANSPLPTQGEQTVLCHTARVTVSECESRGEGHEEWRVCACV